jgi:hypothetical protein
MKRTRGWRRLWTASLGLALAAGAGCQTWVPGAALTLPSPHYLEHPPQYIPPSPHFPLSRELASQEATWAQGPVGGPGPLPAPVGGPAPLPAPVVPRP